MDAIVDECIALVAPDAQYEAECRHDIECMIKLQSRIKNRKIEAPSELLEKEKERARLMYPTAMGRKVHHEALLRFADALADAAAQLPHCGWILDVPDLELQLPNPFHPRFHADEFSKQLEILVTVARGMANNMRVQRGRPRDSHKEVVAGWARYLINKYGTKPLTLTIDGPYYELASVLYRAGTGEHEADLSRHCKLVARRTKGRNKQL
jgi:hypothetical protein